MIGHSYKRYNTGIRRLLAGILDGFVVSFIFLVLHDPNPSNSNTSFIIMVLQSVINIFYSVLMHARYGQTVGKMIVGVKVIDVSEERDITLKQAFMRDSVWIVFEVVGLAYTFYVLQTNKKLPDEIMWLGVLPFLWFVAELVSMLTNEKRRAIHDLIARSVVVRYDRGANYQSRSQ